MRVAILGAGSIGGVVAWHLIRAGHDVTLIARRETAALYSREGLTVEGPDGQSTLPVAAASDPAEAGPFDALFVGLKAQDWRAALPMIGPAVARADLVVPLLNGIPWWFFDGLGGPHEGRRIAAVDPDGAIAAAVPAEKVVGAVVYIGASRTAANRIVWNGRRRLVLGEPAGGMTGRLENLAEALRAAGMEIEASEAIRRDVFMKLLGNATYNPLSVVTGATIGRMAGDPPLARIVRAIMAECTAVGQALGVLGPIDLDQRMVVSAPMRNFKTSMLQDFEAGRTLETGAIVDAVVELGRLVDVPTQMLETIGALAEDRWRTRWGG